MNESGLTDWFSPEIRPVHVGFYLSQIFDGGWIYDWMVWFDGRHWRDHSGCTLIDQAVTWRGLIEQSKEAV
jgi:hypothetical protein